MRGRFILALSSGIFATSVSLGTKADTGEDVRRRAAAAFDDGVARFKRADYQGATKAFLLADEIAPSGQAITNALAAARRANDFLSVAEAAERAISRGETGAVGASAREALAAAMPRLSAIEASCDPTPCALSIDGRRVAAGRKYVLPGTHDVTAETPDGASAAEHVTSAAGDTYRVVLHAEARPKLSTVPSAAESRTTNSALMSPPASAESTNSALVSPQPSTESAPAKTIPPGVFYAGVAASAVLAGLTTWSGLDAIAARRKYDDAQQDYDPDAVHRKALRTDALLVATALIGGTTGYLAFRLVNWGPRHANHGAPAVSLSVSPAPFGGGVVGLARF